MRVTLLNKPSVMNCIRAIRKCWRSEHRMDSAVNAVSGETIIGKNDAMLIGHVIEHGHTSTLEHVVFTFEIEGMSRAMLQELARHRIASLSVESSRYCLKRLLRAELCISDSVVSSGNEFVDAHVKRCMESLIELMIEHPEIPNDTLKYGLVEAFKTNLVWTINARSLRNFLSLRTNPRAHFEIRALANAVFECLPGDCVTLVEDTVWQ